MKSEIFALKFSGLGWRKKSSHRLQAEMDAIARARGLLSMTERSDGDRPQASADPFRQADEPGRHTVRLVVDKDMAASISQDLFRTAASIGAVSPRIQIHETVASIDAEPTLEGWLKQRVLTEVHNRGAREGAESHVGVIRDVAHGEAYIEMGKNNIVSLPMQWISNFMNESGSSETNLLGKGQFIVLAMHGGSVTGVEAILVPKSEREEAGHSVQREERQSNAFPDSEIPEGQPGDMAV